MSQKSTTTSKRPEYYIYTTLKQRCYNPRHEHYDRYGGRGIAVCERWRESFADFLTDMGERPSPHHTIERINNDGPYSPDNCRWATKKEQARNRTSNWLIECEGTTRSLAEWSEISGVPRTTITSRIKRSGWSTKEAVFTPTLRYRKGGIGYVRRKRTND